MPAVELLVRMQTTRTHMALVIDEYGGTDGLVSIEDLVELVVGDIEVGMTYRGVVKSTKEFGAFIECLPGKEGLVHISELSDVRVENTEDVCRIGDEMVVKCIGVDDKGRVRLSRKAVIYETQGLAYEAPPPAEPRRFSGSNGRSNGRFSGNRSR
jgi:predicted RNA-binding protein with RPS1 domain